MSYNKEKLGTYIDILSGFAFKTKDFVDVGIPVIKIKNINPPFVSLDNLTYVSKEIAEKQNKFVLSYDDVLIAMTGSHINQWDSVVGRVARVKYYEKTLLNQRVGKIIIKENSEADINYIYYFLSQDKVKIELASKAGGAANQANISPSHIKELQFPCPKYKTQIKIAQILCAYDNLIENNQKQIKLLEEAAQRLYKEWFVDLRFPGYEKVKVIDGVPEGWKTGTLGDVVVFRRGKTITKAQVQKGNIPVVAGGLEPAYYHNKANTVSPVITVSGSGANAGYSRLYNMDIFASDCSFADSKATPYLFFIYCFLKGNKTTLDALQKGAAQPHVYAKDINAMKLTIPTEDRLEAFCKFVFPYFEKIKVLQRQIEILSQARDRLLPKLINGELEV